MEITSLFKKNDPLVFGFALKREKKAWANGAFAPLRGHICVPKLHTAHRNDLWWRARVWEESTRDQKTRSMLKREPRRSATSHSRQGKQHVFIITLPGWQTATTDWSYSNRKITVYRHETGNPHLFNTWITSLLWSNERFLANGPANFPSRGTLQKCTRTHLHLVWRH